MEENQGECRTRIDSVRGIRAPKESPDSRARLTTRQASSVQGKYLYCLIKERRGKKFDVSGIENKKVYTLNKRDFAAVVSDAEVKDYSISRENTLTHQKVIEEVMKEYDVLPFGFGIVAPNVKNVYQTLKTKKGQLEREFEKIKDKVELNLKALWQDMPAVFREIAKNSPEVQRAKKQKTDRNVLIQIGELVAKHLERKREKEAQGILKPLKKVAVDFKENKIFGDDMILSAAFLVEKNKEKEFDKEINALGKRYKKKIKFIYVGPLPPYNFIHLEI